jgi:hypothetical protein
LRFAALVGLLTTVGFAANVGDVMYVNRVSLPIRSGKFAFNKVVAMAVQGDQLTVTGVEGDWLKVQYLPKATDQNTPPAMYDGYVMEQALSARQVTAASIAATGSASQAASAGAGRGLLDAGKYAAAKGLVPDAFYKMVTDSRGSMNDVAFDTFTKEAKIGPYKPKNVAVLP